jgi:hypothetical protein
MSEALWAQVISGTFGLATMVVGVYLPARIRRRQKDESAEEEAARRLTDQETAQ